MRVARFRCPVQPHHSLSGVRKGTMPIPQVSPCIVLRIRVSSFCSREKASKCRRCKILASILVSAPPVFALTRRTAVKYSATTGACTKCFGGPFNRTMRTVFHPSRSAGSSSREYCQSLLAASSSSSSLAGVAPDKVGYSSSRWACIRRQGGLFVVGGRLATTAEEQARHKCLRWCQSNLNLIP